MNTHLTAMTHLHLPVAQFMIFAHRGRLHFPPLLIVAAAVLVLFASGVFLPRLARAGKWNPQAISPLGTVSIICATALLAGLLCSLAVGDIHLLLWWLLALPVAAVLFL